VNDLFITLLHASNFSSSGVGVLKKWVFVCSRNFLVFYLLTVICWLEHQGRVCCMSHGYLWIFLIFSTCFYQFDLLLKYSGPQVCRYLWFSGMMTFLKSLNPVLNQGTQSWS
jgi:hypothetical protein